MLNVIVVGGEKVCKLVKMIIASVDFFGVMIATNYGLRLKQVVLVSIFKRS